jgi:hypothetical protein
MMQVPVSFLLALRVDVAGVECVHLVISELDGSSRLDEAEKSVGSIERVIF